MLDLNKLRSEFEAIPEIKAHLDHGNIFWSDKNQTYASEFQCLHAVACYVNGAWFMFQEKAKAQAVLDTQQKLTDTYYLEGSDYVVDCPFEYDIEIDKEKCLSCKNGNVLSQQKYILQISMKMKITLKFFNSLQKPKLKMQLQKT